MGCDGGTIPRRDELVRVRKKPEQKDKDAEREFRWLHCYLTQQRLQEPIAMCGLGRLYSKVNIIEKLLDKSAMPEGAQHIRNMKDVRALNLTPNPAYTEEDKSEGLLDTRHAPYICKLIGLEMTGKFRFVALWSCGCVMSERALKQIKSTSNVCPLCQEPFAVEDVIVLNGNEEDLELLKVKMQMRAERKKASKKSKKEKKFGVTEAVASEESVESLMLAEHLATTSSSAPATVTTASIPLNDEVKAEDFKVQFASDNENVKYGQVRNPGNLSKTEQSLKNSKSNIPANIKRLRTASTNALQDPDLKRLKESYSVASDPKATDVYKSLFTSHKTEKEQQRAHWVTYNPFYN